MNFLDFLRVLDTNTKVKIFVPHTERSIATDNFDVVYEGIMGNIPYEAFSKTTSYKLARIKNVSERGITTMNIIFDCFKEGEI